jgi:hypothetical protein
VVEVIIKIDLSHENIERLTSERLRNLRTESFDNNFYDRGSLEILEENDEINSFESGFMSGYLCD